MNLLIVLPYVPWPLNRGTYHRVFHLTRELARHHVVDLFCLDSEAPGAAPGTLAMFQEFCRRVAFAPFVHPPWQGLLRGRLANRVPATIEHWRHPDCTRALQRFAGNERYDLLHFCDLVLWQHISTLPHLPPLIMDRSRVDLLFQTEELAHLKLGFKERLLRRENLAKLRRYESEVAKRVAATVVCGPDDETFLRAHVPEARVIKVLANGVDENYFDAAVFPPQPDPEPTILFCGAMDYSPNVNGLAWYFESCDALVRTFVPNRRVLIVGRNPVASVRALAQLPGVTVAGDVPDVRPWYQRAWVQMVPLLIGGGTRLKIVESLALGTPVVSTTIGAQGLDLVHGEHLLLGDDPGTFAEALSLMLQDETLRQRLATGGRAQVLNYYTWRRLGAELADYYAAFAPEP